MHDSSGSKSELNEFQDSTPPAGASPAFNLSLIYYVIFRHKWKILALTVLGLVAGVAFRKLVNVPFTSNAQVLIRYIEESGTVTMDDDSKVLRPDLRGDTIIKTEIAILSSYDLAREVANTVGPQRLLGSATNDPAAVDAAAAVVYGGISVSQTGLRSQVLNVRFSHQDPALTQPVLEQLIAVYLRRHAEIHGKSTTLDHSLTQETDLIRERLVRTEEDLRKALDSAGVLTLEGAKQVYAERISRTQESILQAEAELAERRAELAAITGAAPEPVATEADTAAPQEPIPEEKTALYRQVMTHLQTLRARENELLTQFTQEARTVKGIRSQIEENENLRSRLENEYPGIAGQVTIREPIAPNVSPATGVGTLDPFIIRTRVSSLESRMKVLRDQLARVRSESQVLSGLETSITELQRRKNHLEQQFRLFTEKAEQNRINEALGPGRVSNISIVQSPSPPSRDMKRVNLIALGVCAGGLVLGLALAFVIDLFLDTSVKRPTEIEHDLGLPLALAIPVSKTLRRVNPANKPAGLLPAGAADPAPKAPADESGLVPRSNMSELAAYFDALRNRLIYNFEMRGITRKPKLVGVTSCGSSSGVSTVAANLAASLSETGDGNVLLVDMNPDRKTAQHFRRGALKVKLDDVLARNARDDALVQDNLYVVSPSSADDKLSWIMPKRFASLVPKMKASDFDYIIFDMPAVSHISATPQLARYMDQVLLVVESEKTSRSAVKRAGAMLSEAGANVGVVLNKIQAHVPKILDSSAMAG